MTIRSWLVGVFVLVAAVAPNALAEEPRAKSHFGFGFGGYLALSGVGDEGPAGEIEWYPGGSWKRFGIRASYYGFNYDFEGALLTAGMTYTAAAKRPKIHIAFHAELAGTADDPQGTRIGAGGGLHTQLWIWGPIALGFDSTVHVLFGGDEDAVTFNLASATTLRLSF